MGGPMGAGAGVLAQRVRTLREPLRIPAVRTLWIAQALSEIGDWAARIALSVLVFERTGSAVATGITLAVSLLPWLGPGQLLTSWSERWSRRRVLVTADVLRAVVFALVALPLPLPVLLVLVFVAGLATPPFNAARSAITPELVPPGLLGPTIALSGMTEEVAVAAGYVAGGAVLTVLGPPIALLVNAGTFAGSALLLRALPAVDVAKPPERRLRSACSGLLGDPYVRRAALLVVVANFAGTGLVAVSAPLVLGDLHSSPLVLTAMLTLTSAVTFVVTGALRLGTSATGLIRRCGWLLTGGGLGLCVGLVATGALPGARLGTAAFAFAACGLLFVVITPANTLVAPRLPSEFRASAFALLMGVTVASEALGAALLGVAASLLGSALAGAVAAGLALVSGTLSLLRPPRAVPTASAWPAAGVGSDAYPAPGPTGARR